MCEGSRTLVPGARTFGGKKGTSVCVVFLLKKGALPFER